MIDADSSERASLIEIEADARRRRLRRNRRQRELHGPKHIRRRRELAKRLERGETFVCPRCRLAPIRTGTWATTTGIPRRHGPNIARAIESGGE